MYRHLKTIRISLLLFLIFLPSLALSQTAVGKFTFVQGRVDVLRQPAPRAVPVKMGDAVFVGDIIRAKSASKAEITFKDGNIVRVAPNTRVEISEYMFDEAKGKGVLKLSRGKVQTIIQEKIAKRIATFGEVNRFEIHTPTAIAGARGCNFIVSFQKNSSNVLVLEGTVFTYNPKFPDMAVTVTAGYVATIPLNLPAQPARPFTDAEKKMHEGDFAPGGSGKKSESEDTVISEATTGSAEPGEPEPGSESSSPTGNLTETPQNLTEIVQPPPIIETAGTDKTPPVINITGPPDLSNLPVSSFNVTSDETVTFTYQMESWGAISSDTTSDNFNLEGLPDDTYMLKVTATDQSGNQSTVNYTWTIDRTGPVVSITPTSASPEAGTGLNSVNVNLSSNETSTYYYKLNEGEWNETRASLVLTNLGEGLHTVEVKAEDTLKNPSSMPPSDLPLTFELNQYSIAGNFYGCIAGVYGTASGEIAGVQNQNWGGWIIDMNGSGGYPNPTWIVSAGGRSSDNIESNSNGYWLLVADGATDYDLQTLSGTSSLKYLSYDRHGTGTGSLTGTHDGYGNYQLTDIGLGTYTETPLAFGGSTSGNFMYWNGEGMSDSGLMQGLMGGTESLWSGSPSFLSLGTYEGQNGNTLWSMYIGTEDISGWTSDGGAILGSIGGIVLDDNLEGRALALYIKPNGEGYEAGYIRSDNVSGSLYKGIGMYELGGNLIAVSMDTTSISPDNLSWDGFYGDSPSLRLGKAYGTIEGDIEGFVEGQTVSLVDQPWGILWGSGGGLYTDTPSPNWIATAEGESYDMDWNIVGIWGSQTIGSQWSDNKIAGNSTGYFADISSTPITGISVGETLGTFDPNLYTWQAVSMGVWLETNKFLEMAATTEGQAKLQQLNIPCVEVGRTNLSGALLANDDYVSMVMDNVIFFAPNTGAKPSIWATNEVTGSYTFTVPGQLDGIHITDPVNQFNISNGNGISADFQFKQWDNGKWIGTIENGKAQPLSGGSYSGDVDFHGAGAGGYTGATSGSISGTAAGVAK